MLDLACGPGNTTRRLASHAGTDGLVVGLDASTTGGQLDRFFEWDGTGADAEPETVRRADIGFRLCADLTDGP